MNRTARAVLIVFACAMMAVQVVAAVLRSYATLALAEPWWEAGKVTSEIPTDGTVIVRELTNLDALSADTLEALLAAEVTFTNPKVNGQTYTGTYVNTAIELIGVDARSATIRQTMRMVSSPTNATDLAALEYTQLDKNEILDVFSLETGEKDTRALQWRNINPSSRTDLMAIADSNLVSQFATGYLYVDREFKMEDDGTASFSLLFQKATWNAWSGEDINSWTFLRRINPGRDNPGLQKTWTGIAIDDAKGAALDVATNTLFITSGYSVTDTMWSDNGNESANIVQTQIKLDVTVSTSRTENAFSDVSSSTVANKANALTPNVTLSGGVIKSQRSTLGADGLYTHQYNWDAAQPVTSVVTSTVSEFATSVVIHEKNASAPQTADAVTGQVVSSSVSGQQNQYGLWDSVKSTLSNVDISLLGTNGTYTWTQYGPQTYFIGNYAGDIMTGGAWYYKTWNHTMKLYETEVAAWNARGSDVVTSNLLRTVGTFAPGIYYYHTVQRAATDANAGKP